jgi:hypothetical protein
MTWIRTYSYDDGDEALRAALDKERALYPPEYRIPTGVVASEADGIVASHSLIPDALYHAFATFGVLTSADLPLSRRQQEMITTAVSVANRCFY